MSLVGGPSSIVESKSLGICNGRWDWSFLYRGHAPLVLQTDEKTHTKHKKKNSHKIIDDYKPALHIDDETEHSCCGGSTSPSNKSLCLEKLQGTTLDIEKSEEQQQQQA